jgi:hypothetical protein
MRSEEQDCEDKEMFCLGKIKAISLFIPDKKPGG